MLKNLDTLDVRDFTVSSHQESTSGLVGTITFLYAFLTHNPYFIDYRKHYYIPFYSPKKTEGYEVRIRKKYTINLLDDPDGVKKIKWSNAWVSFRTYSINTEDSSNS